MFTWARIAGLAGLALGAAGAVYLTKTDKGRALSERVRARGRELWLKVTETGETTTQALPETTSASLPPTQETPAPAEQPA